MEAEATDLGADSVNEEVQSIVRNSQVDGLPQIAHQKPARESTMRNVLSAVNRILETTKVPRERSAGGTTTLMQDQEEDLNERTEVASL